MNELTVICNSSVTVVYERVKALLVPNRNIPWCGFANGYVGVPVGHVWHNVGYNDIHADVHGGLTYSEEVNPVTGKNDGLWWVGFDVRHSGDSPETCDEKYCIAELINLYNQAVQAYSSETIRP